MSSPPTFLLNDTASVATMLLSAHHGFRRDLALFGIALGQPTAGEAGRASALGEEWRTYHGFLHAHHTAEDTGIFPQLAASHPELQPIIAELTADHRRIDPLLERGDAALAHLAEAGPRRDAAAVVRELSGLLDRHLASEEASVVPHLRAMTTFAVPVNTDAEAETMAQAFAWSTLGLAPEVLARVHAMLPASILSRLPAARAAYAARCVRAWGSVKDGASRTAVPDWLAG